MVTLPSLTSGLHDHFSNSLDLCFISDTLGCCYIISSLLGPSDHILVNVLLLHLPPQKSVFFFDFLWEDYYVYSGDAFVSAERITEVICYGNGDISPLSQRLSLIPIRCSAVSCLRPFGQWVWHIGLELAFTFHLRPIP